MVTNAPRTDDPYHLTAEGIQDPPTGWRASLRYLGPGLIPTASIVGSGELIATTALGAEVGFALLWLVIVSTFVKVAVQVELARWTIASGKPGLTGYNRVPPKVWRLSWVTILWLLLALTKVVQTGGVVGGAAVACSILLPIGGEPLSSLSIGVWTVVLTVGSIAMLYTNRYRLVERGSLVLVVTFSLLTVVIAVGLPFTPFGYGGEDVLGGLALQIPAGALGAALAMFGITGVGADEITQYTYWCIEKGYARWTGPNDGSDDWVRRANGWIRVMYKDAFLSWIIYTFSTLAFYLMGASVLHAQGLVPQGNEVITTLSRMYTDTLGEWARVLFLLGAIAVLGSTMWAAIPSWARMWANFIAEAGGFDWNDQAARLRWIRVFTVAFPTSWAIAYLLARSPVVMVQIGGVATGIFLLAVVIAVWYLRRNEIDRRLHGGRAYLALLVASSIAIALLGVYSGLDVFGLTPG